MVSFPNCKINIGLRIENKRPDGFHDLETVFFPIALNDAIEIIEDTVKSKPITWSQTGLNIPGSLNDNICHKAYRLLKKDFPNLPNVKMHLHKAIPLGAGLGGGSADGAFMLKLINEKFSLHLTTTQLLIYALELGSDCPFFIINKPSYAKGRGEKMEEIEIDLAAYRILLVNPGIHISTAWAFSKINPGIGKDSLKDLVRQPVEEWQNSIFNDFEKPVFEAEPETRDIKEALLSAGAVFASMSGSGSTIFGIFNKKDIPVFNFPPHYFLKWV